MRNLATRRYLDSLSGVLVILSNPPVSVFSIFSNYYSRIYGEGVAGNSRTSGIPVILATSTIMPATRITAQAPIIHSRGNPPRCSCVTAVSVTFQICHSGRGCCLGSRLGKIRAYCRWWGVTS
jgi:hypothetical protein